MNKKLHPAISEHLSNLGFESDDSIETYLFPALSELPAPDLFKSMDHAVDLVLYAMKHGHDILVWGDYDVDGITGAALLVMFFRKLGYEPKYHIPDRLTEGYGLNIKQLTDLAETMSQDKLLITVDCGISNSTEIKAAKELGFRVIVTDHHQVGDNQLIADATIDPKQAGCQFPFKDLAGVGVSFYFAAAIRARYREYKHLNTALYDLNMKSFTGIVALGTLADVMPLSGVNRILTKAGFEAIAEKNNPAIVALLHGLDIDPDHLNSEQVSFKIAPVINAAGRMGESELPFSMLTSDSSGQTDSLVKKMIRLNNDRKMVSRRDLELAQSHVIEAEVEQNKCIIIYDKFHDGVLGITASRLCETYRVPTLVCCAHHSDNAVIKGSGRAPVAFNLYKILGNCQEILISFGGHDAAAGFSLYKANLVEFKRIFAFSVQEQMLNNVNDSIKLENKLIKLSISEALDTLLIRNLVQLEPFGEGNPRPIFWDPDVKFISTKYFGINNEHVRGLVRGQYRNIPFIGFNLAKKFLEIDNRQNCSMSFTHMLDQYKGRLSWKIRADNVWQ